MRLFKPMKGCRVFTSDKHMTKPAGELLGWVDRVDENLCYFHQVGGGIDVLIWRFTNSGNGSQYLNAWHEFLT